VVLEERIEAHRAMDNDFYFTRGALMYSLPIEDVRQVTQEFANNLKNWDIIPANKVEVEVISELEVQNNVDINLRDGSTIFKYKQNQNRNISYPYDEPFGFIEVELLKEGKPYKVQLLPYGSTTLRKTTFRKNR
jgi:hypothetical protein